ncbi:MAG: FAD-dependent oxidoreductase [Saprospiraceae bacterium]
MKYEFSYWEYESFLKDIDVAIIGSGIVGLSAAIQLKKRKPKLKVLVLERGPLPLGASTRNAGFACIGSMTEIMDDLLNQSEDEVFSLIQKRYNGLRLLRTTLGDKNIRYKRCKGYELFRDEDKEAFDKCKDQISYVNTLLQPITGKNSTFHVVENGHRSFGLSGCNHLIVNEIEGSIHVGEMMKNLIKLARENDVEILSGVNVNDIIEASDCVRISVNDHKFFTCKNIIIATNGLAKHLIKDVEIKPARNQVLLTSPIPNLKLKGTFHYKKGYVYFRNVEDRVLIGGFRHLEPNAEETDVFGSSETIQDALREFLNVVILKGLSYKIEHKWSGILGVGDAKAPIVKMVSPHCLAAVRLGGMGVAIGSLVGREAADLILDL